ncbi:hypothetical protein [Pseudomonas fluorescens]|uniref:Sialate O-acetylesterase domain-containing protein n=1 Tax=Pseudomonas fluorescens TaxID=294 RepID=A0A5E7BMD5_PSEFL|nr:hypothetical protein [Pseudomonas fluorescens]VVN93288.1 hypothetical protein PS691_02039 [Pseudomonas fluorescens]
MELKNFVAQDEQGNALPGATCFLYARGTETLASGIVKANGIVLANPFTADGDGLIQLAAPNGLYDLRVVLGMRDYRLPVQFNDVTESVAAAEASANRAETARDVAEMSAGVFPTIAAGLAATALNHYFSVPSAESNEYLILYQNVAGGEIEIKRFPSTKAVSDIRKLIDVVALNSDGAAHSFVDQLGFVIAKLMSNGDFNARGLGTFGRGDGMEINDKQGFTVARIGADESMISGLRMRPSLNPGVEIQDQHGFILARFDATSIMTKAAAANEELAESLELDQQQNTDVKQVLCYGQSLERGVQSLPAISTTQPYFNLMIASGVKIRSGEAGYDASGFVPLVESTSGSEGESPVAGLCNGVVRRAVADGEHATDWVFLGSAPGRSGKSVESLSPGGEGDFERMVQNIKDCNALCSSQGKSHSVWAFTWAQGETNYIGNWTHSSNRYMQLQLEVFDKLSREVQLITGQKFRPYLFTYQVGGHRKYSVDHMDIALAQWRASRHRPDVVMATPVYIFPVASDKLHLTNEGSWLMGEYRSRAMYHTMIRRAGKWRPLEPMAVDWKPAYIDIKFHVPCGELVLDDALCAITANKGFDVREASVLADIIQSVTVTSWDTVRVSLTRPAAADSVLSYGRGRNDDPVASGPVEGARGNLRDTHGLYDTATSPLNNTFALHNACVMFEFSRRYGF